MRHACHRFSLALMLLLLSWPGTSFAQALFHTPTVSGSIPVQSWKSLRDAHVVKQNWDYSCGAASLATVLQEFYGQPVSEAELLKAMGKAYAASLADMATVVRHYGFKGVGLAVSFEQLQKLKVPAIVYLRYRGDDHFSVLRGVTEETVWLGDPSWGNRQFSKAQFLAMWETRENAALKGKILVIVPEAVLAQETNPRFFHEPDRSTLPIELLLLRRF